MTLEAFIQLVVLWCGNTTAGLNYEPETCIRKCRDMYEKKIVEMTPEKIFMVCTKEKK